ncbi:hypothetical protein [Nocardioides sp. LHG3406-4]|uniref:hypothetical protein n=1 Tax=Nocardioides sp. LHG3406-4 TaxID=2804575 RepID=UPI003CE950C2
MLLDHDALVRLRAAQCGVVARRQVLDLGGSDSDIERLLRRREWVRMHSGVYLDHTGVPTWEQRAWAAVLFYWPAALAGAAALRAHGVRDVTDSKVIRVAVDGSRSVRSLPGLRVSRVSDLDRRAQFHLRPPRLRLEEALVQHASTLDEVGAVAVLADVMQTRRTTPARVVAALDALPRLRRRAFLRSLLDDVASGAYSVLERRYLVEVERPHGLPAGRRQRRAVAEHGVVFRDVEYVATRTVVELDGRLGHEGSARWTDLDRDLHAALENRMTLRIGWKQVLDPCRLAATVARILAARGWRGRPRACREGCPVADIVRYPARRAGDPTVSKKVAG